MTEEIDVYLFDIDGCAMPVAFPKLLAEEQSPEKQLEIAREVNKKARRLKPYPNFLKFLNEIVKPEDVICFITGRKKSFFGQLTYHHLKDILTITNTPGKIIFYPESGCYVEEYYLNWKWITVTAYTQKNANNYVFDDASGYFDQMIYTAELLNRKTSCFYACDDESWRVLLDCWGYLK